MTTNLHDSLEQEQSRLADEPAADTPEKEENEALSQAGEQNSENLLTDTPGASAADSAAEPNGNGMPQAEANEEAETWPEEAGESDGAVADTEAAESVTEKLKNKLRRKAPALDLKQLKADLEKATADSEAFKDKYLRLAAEFDNYRKRIDRDFNSRLQSGFAELVGELLPVLDDLERSLNAKAETQNYESLLEGVKLIQQKFAKVLSERGVEPIQAVGAEFDPNLHDALTEMAAEGKPAGIVLEEHTRGYTYRDRVLRPARVIVSK